MTSLVFDRPDPRLADLLAGYPPALFDDRFYQSVELLDRYGLEVTIDLAHGLGIAPLLRDWHPIPALAANLHFHPRFHRALNWLIQRLSAAGLLETRQEEDTIQYRTSEPLRPSRRAQLRTQGLAIDHANVATLDMLDVAAAAYPAVARGEVTGEEALFGMGRIGHWLNYFHNDNPAYAVNNWLAALAAVERMGNKSPLRILEVGAGAGSASEILLRCLAEREWQNRIESYRITEPNPFFRRRGERALKADRKQWPLTLQALDIDRSWQEQGIEPASCDLIYGVNVLHVARDLRFSLDQAYRTLAPGGWLVIGECLRPFPGQPIYLELIFQILDGFTAVITDPRDRPNPGFLTPEQWQHLFACAGFDPVEITPNHRRIRAIYPRFYTGAVCGNKKDMAGSG